MVMKRHKISFSFARFVPDNGNQLLTIVNKFPEQTFKLKPVMRTGMRRSWVLCVSLECCEKVLQLMTKTKLQHQRIRMPIIFGFSSHFIHLLSTVKPKLLCAGFALEWPYTFGSIGQRDHCLPNHLNCGERSNSCLTATSYW